MLFLTVASVMVAMMVAMAAPAFAVRPCPLSGGHPQGPAELESTDTDPAPEELTIPCVPF